MQKYVAFMTGLPVRGGAPGQERVKKLFSRLGLTSVETFRAADNVIFETAPVGVIGPLEAQISRHLRRSLETEDLWTFIRTPKEIAEIVRDIPFTAEILSK